jgi:hypothetical protein
MTEFIVKNLQTNEEKTYLTITDIVKYFKDTEKYKIPNFIKETLKNGTGITIETPSGKYLINKKLN